MVGSPLKRQRASLPGLDDEAMRKRFGLGVLGGGLEGLGVGLGVGTVDRGEREGEGDGKGGVKVEEEEEL